MKRPNKKDYKIPGYVAAYREARYTKDLETYANHLESRQSEYQKAISEILKGHIDVLNGLNIHYNEDVERDYYGLLMPLKDTHIPKLRILNGMIMTLLKGFKSEIPPLSTTNKTKE